MKNIIEFITELNLNNNKEWFDANRERYKAVQEEFNVFVEKLIDGISKFDPSIKDLAVKDCIYRIYRDVRFSPNKEPYKNHMGAYICPKGKKSGYAGYYFHIEPAESNYIGGNILATGLHMPDPKVVKSVRDEIYDNGHAFVSALHKAKGFTLDESMKLKKIPKGFPEDSRWAEYLKLKEWSLMKFFPDKMLLKDDLLQKTLEAYKGCVEFNHLINRAVDFSYEEM